MFFLWRTHCRQCVWERDGNRKEAGFRPDIFGLHNKNSCNCYSTQRKRQRDARKGCVRGWESDREGGRGESKKKVSVSKKERRGTHNEASCYLHMCTPCCCCCLFVVIFRFLLFFLLFCFLLYFSYFLFVFCLLALVSFLTACESPQALSWGIKTF